MDYYDYYGFVEDYSDQEYDPCPDMDSLLKFESTEINQVLRCCKRTILHHSLRYGLIEKTVQLLDKGADVNIKDESGQTALHIAVADKSISPDVVRMITDKCLDINNKDRRGRTALHIATERRNLKMMKLLLENGALVDSKNKYNETALHLATAEYCVDKTIVILLIDRGASPNVQDVNGMTPLHYAAKYLKTEIIQLLLENGAEVNIKNKDGETPLHIVNGQESLLFSYGMNQSLSLTCKTLSANGADLNAQDNRGNSPLHNAVKHNIVEMIQTLLESGADANSRNKNKETPLHIATCQIIPNIWQSHPGDSWEVICAALLDYGASPNVKNNNGMTPLHNAVKNDRLDFVNLLIKSGADLNSSNEKGETPLHTLSHLGSFSSLVVTCKALLANGALPNLEDDNGMTPLHNAAESGTIHIVPILLDNGAEVNSKNKKGRTPLHIYTLQRHCSLDTFNLLLQKGAKVNEQDEYGRTALHNVSICVNKYHAEKFKADMYFLRDASSKVLKLLEWGASQNIRDNFGKTASDYNCFINTQKKYDIKRACLYSTSNESTDILNPSLEVLKKLCFEEIERMKLSIFGTHSLHDIFRHSADPIFLSDLELEYGIQSEDLVAKFPLYGPLLRSTHRSSRERVQLLDSVPDILQLPLPFEVTRYILTFVDDDSLRNVIRAKEEGKKAESDATSESETESGWELNLMLDYNSDEYEYEDYSHDNHAYNVFNYSYF